MEMPTSRPSWGRAQVPEAAHPPRKSTSQRRSRLTPSTRSMVLPSALINPAIPPVPIRPPTLTSPATDIIPRQPRTTHHNNNPPRPRPHLASLQNTASHRPYHHHLPPPSPRTNLPARHITPHRLTSLPLPRLLPTPSPDSPHPFPAPSPSKAPGTSASLTHTPPPVVSSRG